jgi:imidazolonepropionase-like amidohydrolase
MSGGLIEEVGPRDDSFDGETLGDFDDGVAVPGLIDAHAHLCFGYEEGLHFNQRTLDLSTMAESVRARCRALVSAGVTSVRDLGGVSNVVQLARDAIERGDMDGPRILCSGPPITTPTGHLRSFGLLAADEAGCIEAVETLASMGVDVVKVIATGGASTPGTPLGRAQFSLRELRAIVVAARRLRLPVAAHAHGTEGIAMAAAAGVNTIEHCSWIEPDGSVGSIDVRVAAEMCRRRQVAVIAGPLPGDLALRLGHHADVDARSDASSKRLLAVWDNARRARDLGVAVALGTDALFGQFEDHRDLAWRAQALVELAGWSPALALEALWKGGAAAFAMSGRIGVVAPGACADVVVLGGDPRVDIGALRDVRAVFRGGLQVT